MAVVESLPFLIHFVSRKINSMFQTFDFAYYLLLATSGGIGECLAPIDTIKVTIHVKQMLEMQARRSGQLLL